MDYPNGTTAADFAHIPNRHMEDAVQEAWIGYLEAQKAKRSSAECVEAALKSARSYAKREKYLERRNPNIPFDSTVEPVIPRDRFDRMRGSLRSGA